MAKSSSVLRNASMVTGHVIVKGAVLFFLYRHLLNTLGADQVGIWAIVLATTAVSRVSELGLSGGATKFVAAAHAKGDYQKAADIVQTTLLTIGVLLAVILSVGYFVITWLLFVIIPADSVKMALDILPYALMSVWLSGVGGVVSASLDGCHRVDLRAVVDMVSSVLFLLLVLVLTSTYELVGLAVAQVSQALFVAVVGWLFLRRQLSALPHMLLRWNFEIFREMFRYGVNFQIISVIMMLYEPLAKAFLTKFGGLSATAYFDMAYRMVLQFRALLVAANQVLVPKISAVHELSPERVDHLYRESYRVILFLAVPLFLMLAASIPMISHAWIGQSQPDFIFFGLIIAFGYLINTLSAPAYFINLGIGALRWNVISHVTLGFLSAALGYILGKSFGGWGVISGSIIALIIASIITIIGTHRDHHIPLSRLFPKESSWLILASGVAGINVLVLPHYISDYFALEIRVGVTLLTSMLILAPAIWWHPVRSDMWERISGVTSGVR